MRLAAYLRNGAASPRSTPRPDARQMQDAVQLHRVGGADFTRDAKDVVATATANIQCAAAAWTAGSEVSSVGGG